jgi:4,5-DOPA dioxygenase extradiol
MFPKANIPVFQLSLDLTKPPQAHFDLARELKPLRERGVLIIGSGNLVHNRGVLAPGGPVYHWALDFDSKMTNAIEDRDFQRVVQAGSLGRVAQLSHPTIEHFLPTLFSLGVADAKDKLHFFNASFEMASISMRSFVLA